MQLNEFFYKHRKVALAFSGGADSAYLLYAAKENGAEAYYSSDKAEVLDFLKANLRDNDAVLYKASRSMRMEDIIRDYYGE